MSNDRIRELDATLARIVNKICAPNIGWTALGVVIQEELSTVGLQFATHTLFVAGNEGTDWGNWKRARDTASSHLKRIGFMVESSRCVSGTQWYPDEMLRIVKRLMELRGYRH